jgi:hypothetical protein
LTAEHVRQRQLIEENIILIVSAEKYDKAAAKGVRPSSEKRPTTANSGEMMRGAVGLPHKGHGADKLMCKCHADVEYACRIGGAIVGRLDL